MLRSDQIDKLDEILASQPLLSAGKSTRADAAADTADTSHPFFSKYYGSVSDDPYRAAEEGLASTIPPIQIAPHLLPTASDKLSDAATMRIEITDALAILEEIYCKNVHTGLTKYQPRVFSTYNLLIFGVLSTCLAIASVMLSKAPRFKTGTAADVAEYNTADAYGQPCNVIWPAPTPEQLCNSTFIFRSNATAMGFGKLDAKSYAEGCREAVEDLCAADNGSLVAAVIVTGASIFLYIMVQAACIGIDWYKPSYRKIKNAPDISNILPLLDKLNIDVEQQPLQTIILELRKMIQPINPKTKNNGQRLKELTALDIENLIEYSASQENTPGIQALKKEILNQAWNTSPAPDGKLYAFNILKNGYTLFNTSAAKPNTPPTIVFGTGDSVINNIFDYVRGVALPARLAYVEPTTAEKIKQVIVDVTDNLTSCDGNVFTCQRSSAL